MADAAAAAARLRAGDLALSSAELIAVMERVKRGNLSIDAALSEALALDAAARPPASTTTAAAAAAAAPSGAAAGAASPPVESHSTPMAGAAHGTHSPPAAPHTAALSPPASRRRTGEPSASGQLSNEDQVLIMNSVKDGSLSIEQALRLVEGRQAGSNSTSRESRQAGSNSAPRKVWRSPPRGRREAAATAAGTAPMVTSLPSTVTGQDFALLQALAAAGANVGWDVPERKRVPVPESDGGEREAQHAGAGGQSNGMDAPNLPLAAARQASDSATVTPPREMATLHAIEVEAVPAEPAPTQTMLVLDESTIDNETAGAVADAGAEGEASVTHRFTHAEADDGSIQPDDTDTATGHGAEPSDSAHTNATATHGAEPSDSAHPADPDSLESDRPRMDDCAAELSAVTAVDAGPPIAIPAASPHPPSPPPPPGTRVVLTLNRTRNLSKMVLAPQSFAELLATASRVLNCDAKMVFTSSGAELNTIACLRDEDELFVSEGEGFRPLCCRVASVTSLDAITRSPRQLAHVSGENASKGDWIRLNVGGRTFETTRATLTQDPESMLAVMFSSDAWRSDVDETGAFRLDRNPKYFEPLLGFLRDGSLTLDQGISARGVLAEAHFFGLWGAVEELEPIAREQALQDTDNPPIRRKDLVRVLMATSSKMELRFQGLNFEGSDLSRLDLRHANFAMANLKGCNLTNCNLEFCSFERADLSGARLDGSDLKGCIMCRAKLDRASLRNCNFHDPSQCSNASLEGASCRFADFEDSNLSCTNMRVACLKDASLRQCNLRCCNMAGTDLGSCDLSGSNLQGANLRGANTMGAKFHKIASALHMSQMT